MKIKQQNTALLPLLILTTLVISRPPSVGAPLMPTAIEEKIGEKIETSSPTQQDETSPDPMVLKTMSITEPTGKKEQRTIFLNENDHYFYPYRHAMSPRLGAALDLGRTTTPHYILGLNYLLNWSGSSYWEVGADLLTNGSGVAHFCRRWIFNPHASLRPFAKAGAGVLLVASDSLRTLLRWENYQLRGSGGLEYWLLGSTSLRLDLEISYSLNQTVSMALVLGYSWAW